MAYRAAILTALAVGVAPCAAQGIMVPAPVASPAAPASPLPSPSASVPAPALPSLHEDLLKDLPALPDLDSFSPQIAAWVRMRGAGLARGGEIPEADDMPAYLVRRAGSLLQGDPNTHLLAMLLMLEALKSAKDDLIKKMTKKLEEINDTKARPSGENPGYQLPVAPTKADLDAMLELLKKQEGEMSGMSEMESLRLQMAMDRMSKMMSVLNNLLKKQNDTASGIIQNIK
jgi:hypothetical protein